MAVPTNFMDAGDRSRWKENPVAITLPQWPYLRQNSGGHAVRVAQYLLRAHEYMLTVDGIFGPQTDTRVRAFQRDNNLVNDGIVGPLTWAKLIIQVALGSQGDAVRAVQEELLFRHNIDGTPEFDLVVDGIFGPKTDAAIWHFQQVVAKSVIGFAVDGIVGPQTWRALVSSLLTD